MSEKLRRFAPIILSLAFALAPFDATTAAGAQAGDGRPLAQAVEAFHQGRWRVLCEALTRRALGGETASETNRVAVVEAARLSAHRECPFASALAAQLLDDGDEGGGAVRRRYAERAALFLLLTRDMTVEAALEDLSRFEATLATAGVDAARTLDAIRAGAGAAASIETLPDACAVVGVGRRMLIDGPDAPDAETAAHLFLYAWSRFDSAVAATQLAIVDPDLVVPVLPPEDRTRRLRMFARAGIGAAAEALLSDPSLAMEREERAFLALLAAESDTSDSAAGSAADVVNLRSSFTDQEWTDLTDRARRALDGAERCD